MSCWRLNELQRRSIVRESVHVAYCGWLFEGPHVALTLLALPVSIYVGFVGIYARATVPERQKAVSANDNILARSMYEQSFVRRPMSCSVANTPPHQRVGMIFDANNIT